MRSRSPIPAWAALLVVFASLASPGFAEEDVEPGMIFYLEVDGAKIPVELDKAFEFATNGRKTSALLRAEDYRVFPYGGVSFQYPRDFAFEADFSEPPTKIWSLDGSNCVLMLALVPGTNDPETLLETMASATLGQYEAMGAAIKEGEDSIVLENETVEGRSFVVSLGEVQFRQSLFPVKTMGGCAVLTLQDSPQSDGTPTAEAARARKMLEATFRVSRE